MRASLSIVLMGTVVALAAGSGCAYFNTLHNAKQKYNEALDVKARADPERLKISTQEQNLYAAAFEKAAKVVKYYPDSRWVDDALLLMAKASHEKGDYSTALRKYDEILSFYPDSDLVPATLVMEGRTAIEIRDYERAIRALRQAREADRKELRGDVTYFLGVVEESQGNTDGALVAYAEVLERHKGSEWYAEAGMRAGALARANGHDEAAVSHYDRVRKDGRTPRERYDGGMQKGEALLASGEWSRARATFREVAEHTVSEELRSQAFRMEAAAVARSGDPDGAELLYSKVIEDFPRTEAAADAQFAIAERWDQEGDLQLAQEQYELVKEQGTGHEAWQRASARQTQIQRVLDLREEIASGGEAEEERDRKRFLLAEHLLEKIGDVDGALEEYAALASDAKGTTWGSRALFAEAWVLENRRSDPDSAEALLFRLANEDTRSEVGAAARRRHGMPVWKFERVVPPKVVFIRAEGEEAPEEIVLSRVEPRDVPLPPGVSEVKVWARIAVDRDGSVKSAKIVKSGGDEFDIAVLEAARASRFLALDEGGPEITVVEYRFPPERVETGTEGDEAEGETPVEDDEPSADERDAMLDRRDALTATPADSLAAPDSTSSPPPLSSPPPGRAVLDSVAAFRGRTPTPPPAARDGGVGGIGDD